MKAVFQKTDDFDLVAKKIKNFKGFPPMFHSHLELIYVISGEVNMTIDGQSHRLCEGELSMLFPYVIHSYEHAPDAEIIMFLFEAKTVGAFEGEISVQKPICPFLSDARRFEDLFFRITELVRTAIPCDLRRHARICRRRWGRF